MCSLDTERTSDVPKAVDDKENAWNFDGMVPAGKVATFCIRGMLREVQRACEDGGEALSSTVVDVIEPAREDTEIIPKNATLSHQNTDMGAELVEILTDGTGCAVRLRLRRIV